MAQREKKDCCDTAPPFRMKDSPAHTAVSRSEPADRVRATAYMVFPGIELIYHDIHTDLPLPEQHSEDGVLEIIHCHEGRIEYQSGTESFFLAPGDLSVFRPGTDLTLVRFPTGHYHGITVRIDTARSPDCLSCFLEDVDVRISALTEKFCARSPWFAARSSSSIEHVFSELYRVPPEIRKGYFKVKILELLLFLSALPVEPDRPSFSPSQVALAKRVSDYLLENTEERLTVSDLSRHFGASPSMINLSFRGKFAKAFRDVIGVPPNSYRAGIDTDSCVPFEP